MKKFISFFLLLFFLTASGGKVAAQNGNSSIPPPDTILTAIYDCISGPQGGEINLARFRNLYHPDARLIPLVTSQDGIVSSKIYTVEDFTKRMVENRKQSGFWEKELSRRFEQFGNLCQVWSTYEGKIVDAKGETIIRGINSIDLYWDGQRWWVMQVMWQAEGGDRILPKKYLKPMKTKK